jgi:acyl transferase domain-containing protein
MTAKRALIVCPGRGSYNRASLGSLRDRNEAARAIIAACDAWRLQNGRPSVSSLDAEPSFRAGLHLAGEHASLLTLACSLADLAELDASRYRVVGVCGNSMGWYTALAASGALSPADAIRLVDTMGAYQENAVIGGQLMYPAWDAEGDDAQGRTARQVLAELVHAGWRVALSIDLGSHLVLAGDDAGLAALEARLPPVVVGDRTFPARLPLHSAFHTQLLVDTSRRAQGDLADLGFGAPRVPLVDGRGVVYRPEWADPAEIAAYTLGSQVVEPYNFRLGLLSALRHTGAEVVIVLGPGNSLGGPIARILQVEGWGGARGRAAFEAQQDVDPRLLSFGVSLQRTRLVS